MNWPDWVSFSFTTRCNANCWMCARSEPGRVVLWDVDPALYEAAKPYIRNAQTLCLSGYGEFLMYPQAREVLEFCGENKTDVFMTTNATLLPEWEKTIRDTIGKFGWLTLSLQTHLPELFAELSAGQRFDRMEAGVRLNKAVSRFTVVSHTVHARNIDHLTDFLSWCVGHGLMEVSVQHLTIIRDEHRPESLFHHQARANAAFVEARKFADTLGGAFRLHLPPLFGSGRGIVPTRTCEAPNHQIHLFQHGWWRLCCFAPMVPDLSYVEYPPEIILNSARLREIRESVVNGVAEFCRLCPENYYQNPDVEESYMNIEYREKLKNAPNRFSSGGVVVTE